MYSVLLIIPYKGKLMYSPHDSLRDLEESLILCPTDPSTIQSYVRDLVRSDLPINPKLNSIPIATTYLFHRYNITYDLTSKLLFLPYQPISNLTWLSGLYLPNLNRFLLSHTPISSLEDLSNLTAPNLTYLNFNSNNNLTSLSGLSRFHAPHLQYLHLDNNNITSLDDLSNLNAPNLQTLVLSHNNITSIDGLSKFKAPNLENLLLDHNKITSLDVLSGLHLPNLRVLYLNRSLQTSVSGLRRATPAVANALRFM